MVKKVNKEISHLPEWLNTKFHQVLMNTVQAIDLHLLQEHVSMVSTGHENMLDEQ